MNVTNPKCILHFFVSLMCNRQMNALVHRHTYALCFLKTIFVIMSTMSLCIV